MGREENRKECGGGIQSVPSDRPFEKQTLNLFFRRVPASGRGVGQSADGWMGGWWMGSVGNDDDK